MLKFILTLILVAALLFTGCAKSAENDGSETAGSSAETTAPFSERRTYDWSLGTQETESPDEQVGEFALSLYAVSDSRMRAFSDTGYASYAALCDAVRSRSASVTMLRSDVIAVLDAFNECSPYSSLVQSYAFTAVYGDESAEQAPEADINAEDAASPDGESTDPPIMPAPLEGELTITYRLDETAHKSAVDGFEAGTSRLLGSLGIDPALPECAAVLIYRWCAENIDDVTGRDTCVFELLGGGDCFGELTYPAGNAQNSAFRYLLSQAGIPCVTMSGKLFGSARVWTAAQLGGLWYHFDPASEFTDTSGNGLKFFGMNDGDREYEGYTEMSAGFAYTYNCVDLTTAETLAAYDAALKVYSDYIASAEVKDTDAQAPEEADAPLIDGQTASIGVNPYGSFDTRYNSLRDCDFYSFDIATRALTFYHIGVASPKTMTLD